MLAEEHVRLQEAFARHRDALAEGRLAEARRALDEFARDLRAHMRVEEEVLLPLYGARGAGGPGAGVEQFRSEHEKLLRLLERTDRRLAELEGAGAAPPRERVRLLDEEYALRHLLEHHDQRERAAFFPGLDRVIAPAERAEIWRRCAQARARAT